MSNSGHVIAACLIKVYHVLIKMTILGFIKNLDLKKVCIQGKKERISTFLHSLLLTKTNGTVTMSTMSYYSYYSSSIFRNVRVNIDIKREREKKKGHHRPLFTSLVLSGSLRPILVLILL